MTPQEADLAVVHLVRSANGLIPFKQFLDSYTQHSAGTPHDLVLVFKGFRSTDEIEPYGKLVCDRPVHSLRVDDQSYDLGSYFAVAHRLSHTRLCFLNSFSIVQADGWLQLLSGALDEPGVGLAGATGSWASVSSRVHWELGRRGAYAKVFDRNQMFPERLTDTFAMFDPPSAGLMRAHAHKLHTLFRILSGYRRFPSPHIRTNGFILLRETMLGLDLPPPRDKIATHQLECGRHGITTQIQRMGKQAIVVARDGEYYPPAGWARSKTFWQSDQENLLIADNQTENYRRGDTTTKQALSRWAWGAEADPGKGPEKPAMHTRS